jgi:hypothetical protein
MSSTPIGWTPWTSNGDMCWCLVFYWTNICYLLHVASSANNEQNDQMTHFLHSVFIQTLCQPFSHLDFTNSSFDMSKFQTSTNMCTFHLCELSRLGLPLIPLDSHFCLVAHLNLVYPWMMESCLQNPPKNIN